MLSRSRSTNPNGDELYHILRKRLFETVAPEPEIKIAEAYREALREAAQMNLTTSSPEALFTPRHRRLPFHPDLRELVGSSRKTKAFNKPVASFA